VPHDRLLLIAVSGARVEARLVNRGERFGPDGAYVWGRYRPALELVSRGGRLDHYLGAYDPDVLGELGAHGLVPDGKPGYALPPQEVRRLLDWASGGGEPALETGTVLLVGDEHETGRLAAALAHMSLRVEREEDGERALARAALGAADLVIAAPGSLQLGPLEVAAALRASSGGTAVPVVVVGGDRDEAHAAGANAHLDDAGRHEALVRAVGQLLRLV
jgi:hypothetical protein